MRLHLRDLLLTLLFAAAGCGLGSTVQLSDVQSSGIASAEPDNVVIGAISIDDVGRHVWLEAEVELILLPLSPSADAVLTLKDDTGTIKLRIPGEVWGKIPHHNKIGPFSLLRVRPQIEMLNNSAEPRQIRGGLLAPEDLVLASQQRPRSQNGSEAANVSPSGAEHEIRWPWDVASALIWMCVGMVTMWVWTNRALFTLRS